MGKLVDDSFGRIIGSVAKQNAQEILERYKESRKIACYTKESKNTTIVTSKIVWNILLLKCRGKFRLELAGIGKATSIKPAGRTRSIQIGESVGGAIGLIDFGESKIAVNSKEPDQGRKAIVYTLENRWGIQTGRKNHDRKDR